MSYFLGHPNWTLAECHIQELEEVREELQAIEDYYGDHLMITDILMGKDIRPFGDDPDYQSEFENLKHECRELEEPLFRLFQDSREL